MGVQFETDRALSDLTAWIKGVRELVMECSEKAIREVAKVLERKIRANISLTDHTLEQIKEKGHPYSLKNIGVVFDGKDTPRASGVNTMGHKSFQVHIQRGVIRGVGGGPGLLTDALGIDYKKNKLSFTAAVGIDKIQAGHVEYVVFGTRFMVARDFLAGTFLEVVDDLFDIFERESKFNRIWVDTSLF